MQGLAFPAVKRYVGALPRVSFDPEQQNGQHERTQGRVSGASHASILRRRASASLPPEKKWGTSYHIRLYGLAYSDQIWHGNMWGEGEACFRGSTWSQCFIIVIIINGIYIAQIPKNSANVLSAVK